MRIRVCACVCMSVCVFVCLCVRMALYAHEHALIKNGIQAIKMQFENLKMKSSAFDFRACVCACTVLSCCEDLL